MALSHENGRVILHNAQPLLEIAHYYTVAELEYIEETVNILKMNGIESPLVIEPPESLSFILEQIENRKIWCAASTHPDEEFICAKIHLEIKKTFKNILTIIIPRHIDRAEKIKMDLESLKLKIVCYSDFKQLNSDTDIILIDTYGEASKFYNISKYVFVGKSLLSKLIKYLSTRISTNF